MIKCNEKCYGCGACKLVCPQKSIALIENEEGFYYPQIDGEKCIECGLCEKVCPIDKEREASLPIKTYAFKHSNNIVRKKSASGGAFSALSEVVLNQNGCIYGVIYNEALKAEFVRATTKELRNRMRDSKYVQAWLDDTYKRIEQDLKKGEKQILFVGTPCQVAGLKEYLTVKKINTTKLILVDLLCYGVASPKLFEQYIEFCQRRRKEKIINYYHRKKIEPWGVYSEGISYQNGLIEKGSLLVQIWKNLYMSGLMLRPSCYHCKYAKREGDITIGDFWNGKAEVNNFIDDLGVSIVMINTLKGEEIFAKIEDGNKKICKTKAYQPSLREAHKYPSGRKTFWLEYK